MSLTRHLPFSFGAIIFLLLAVTSCKAAPDRDTPIVKFGEKATATLTNSSRVIRITSGEWVPYTGKDLPGYGCDSEIVTEVFRQMGYSVEYEFFPWARAMHFAEIGERDGTIDWGDTPEFREKFFINKDPISNQEMRFFFVKGNAPVWSTLDDLQGKVIGITSGYVYDNVFEENIRKENIHLVEASSDEANFQKLLAGRIDLFPIERNVGMAILQSMFTSEERNKIAVDPKILTVFHPHLLLSKAIPRNSELIKEFDKTFANMRLSQKYSDIVNSCSQ